MSSSLAFIDELEGATYQSLSATNFQLGIVDPDASGLTTSEIGTLEASGKTMIAYISIGEAQDFRSYWQTSWNTSLPSFLLGADPNWPGDYYAEYWNPAWQKIIINYADNLAKEGYNGIMMDLVDVYNNPTVAAAAGGIAAAEADMQTFVEAISASTKAINPNFKIIPNNAEALYTVNPSDGNPSDATNTAYMSSIDGVLAETTFYNPNNTPTTWQAANMAYLEHAVAAGKTVLDIEYPTSTTATASAVSQALAAGYVPYIADQALDTNISTIDYTIPAQLPAGSMSSVIGTKSSSTTYTVVDVPNGTQTLAANAVDTEFVFGANYKGHATIDYFATASGDIIDIAPSIFSTAQQALNHVTYSGSNAIINLGTTHGTITLVGVGAHSLVTADFHIG